MMSYKQHSDTKAQAAIKSGHALILAIETSCDETAAAVVKDGRTVLSSAVYSQIEIHRAYGGVVPEIASRNHTGRLSQIVSQALGEACVSLDELDAIAVTCGPGLVGALLTGVSYAKGLALARNLPLIGVHHIFGHICANLIADSALAPPFLCITASGGHSQIIAVDGYDRLRVLGSTHDDAAGEAFDKAARALGLPYPGGPELEKLALDGNDSAYTFQSAFNAQAHYDFSFSGIKTNIVNLIHNAEQKGEPLNKADVAASFQRAVTDILASKAVRAAKELEYGVLALSGGVSANKTLRATLQARAQAAGLQFICPPLSLCGDNAAMIGSAGFYRLMSGRFDGLSLNAQPDLDLEEYFSEPCPEPR